MYREIPDAKEWEPEEGDELIGIVWDLGWDKKTDVLAANVKPEDSTELRRVWPRDKDLGREWDDEEIEEGTSIKITYHGGKEMMKRAGSDQAPTYHKYEVQVLD